MGHRAHGVCCFGLLHQNLGNLTAGVISASRANGLHIPVRDHLLTCSLNIYPLWQLERVTEWFTCTMLQLIEKKLLL